MERNYGEDIAPIEVNSQDVTRVFLNLFGNGFYAANKRARDNAAPGFEPTVKVTTRDPGDAIEIRVRDNGIGIPAEIVDKLFQPFFTTRPTGEGTGLGRGISYDVVTGQHGGSDAVDSRVGALPSSPSVCRAPDRATAPRAIAFGGGGICRPLAQPWRAASAGPVRPQAWIFSQSWRKHRKLHKAGFPLPCAWQEPGIGTQAL